MAAYHQMGHDSRNLILDEADLVAYRGAVLSPVNELPIEMSAFLARLVSVPDFETIFDPQLYFPNAERETLRKWSYFPKDVETADTASEVWWQRLTDQLINTCESLAVKAVCSPVQIPGAYTDAYYAASVQTAKYMQQRLSLMNLHIRGLQTAVVSLPDLQTYGRALAIASILSQTAFDRIYIVFSGGPEPRREIENADRILGAMRLIAALKDAQLRVLVGYTSTDVILWKTAGAHDCASGKFFNLRRFTGSRFEDAAGGGGQVAYLIEEDLVAFLRPGDIPGISSQGMMSDATLENPYFNEVKTAIESGNPWLAVSWRFFLYWFAEVQDRLETDLLNVPALLRDAETRWQKLEDADILMDEPRNDGRWIRQWRKALSDFRR